ncbi:hypothetical protein NLI96_g1449 [Meripilus lineatus]|uniref:Tetratricopeptide repeat protein n=1 Tax=Meripilus lineatus TaxID=2056292 RepID=A0AAD5VEV3_9APHY|nr:hypothetical protein NLI96_g1449 [Physisporinus lineatus]
MGVNLVSLGRLSDAVLYRYAEMERWRVLLQTHYEQRDSMDKSLWGRLTGRLKCALATSLSGISDALNKVGEHEKALSFLYKEARIRQILVDRRWTGSDFHRRCLQVPLARALRAIGTTLIKLCHYEKALEYLHQEIDIWQEPFHPIWNSGHPKALLAASLDETSLVLSDFGCSQGAHTYFRRKAQIRQGLFERYPILLSPLYHQSLDSMSWNLIGQNQHEEALLVIQEWTQLLHSDGHTDQVASEETWCDLLHTRSVALVGVGKFEAACTASEECVTRRRGLLATAHQHEDYRFDLATALHNLAHPLSELDRDKEALEAIEEALSIHRNLVSEDPLNYEDSLRETLYEYALVLAKADRSEEAVMMLMAGAEELGSLETESSPSESDTD